MTALLKYISARLNPPDIRKVYKLHREAVHFIVHSAAYVNDGHYDRFIKAYDGHDIRVRVYPPRLISPKKRLILFFHGGGWVIDNIDRYHKICRQLAEITGSYVISVDYRLAPEYKFPCGFNDCYDAARYIYAAAAEKGISPRDIILAGDSAGGNLAAAVSLKARDTAEFKVYRQMLIYPVTACEFDDSSPYRSMHDNGTGCLLTAERMRGYLELYLDDISMKDDPYVAPIKASSLAGMPSTLVVTAGLDPLRDEGIAFAKRLYKTGGNVKAFCIEDAYHGFFATDLKMNAHAKKAVSMMMYFIRLTD